MKRWNLFEDLTEKTIQWKPTPKKSRNTIPISSKRGLYSIESFIAVETKIVSLMRRLVAPKPRSQLQSTKLAQTNSQLWAAHIVKHEICVWRVSCFSSPTNFVWTHECSLLKAPQQSLCSNVQSWLEKSPEFLWSQNNHDHWSGENRGQKVSCWNY